MAEMRVTVHTHGKTWGELIEEAERVGVPSTAEYKLYEFKSYNAIDWDAERIVFSWSV